MLQKYMKGHFGPNAFPDLDYSIKRLVSGLGSDSAECKEGYFLALVLIIKQFWSLISKENLIKHIVEETLNSKALKKSEKSHFAVGRLLSFNAIVEAMPIENDSDDWIDLLGKELLSVFNHNEGLR